MRHIFTTMLSIKIFFQNRRFFAPAFLYSCFSLVFSTWIIYIPYIAEKLNISEGHVGGALFFTSLGSFVMIPVSNKLIDVLGVGRQAFWGFVAYAVSLYGIFLVDTYTLLCAALFVFGMMSCIFAISLNSLIANIEKQAGQYIMTGSHGFWSIGGIIGASIGGYFAGKYKMPLVHVSVVVTILVGLQFWLRKAYIHIKSEPLEKGASKRFPIKPLLAIAAVGMVILASEGAIADWSALYLQNEVSLKSYFLGFGYAFFSLGMTIGRFSGDGFSRKLGSWKLLQFAIAISVAGFILVLFRHPIVSIVGFGVVGLGFSVIVPEIYRLASNIKGIRTADGVSFIAATSNVGFLTGPVLLGFIAEVYSLFVSFIILTFFVSSAFFVTLYKRR